MTVSADREAAIRRSLGRYGKEPGFPLHDLTWLLAELAAAREVMADIKSYVYLYRIEHLTPETLIDRIEEVLQNQHAVLDAREGQE